MLLWARCISQWGLGNRNGTALIITCAEKRSDGPVGTGRPTSGFQIYYSACEDLLTMSRLISGYQSVHHDWPLRLYWPLPRPEPPKRSRRQQSIDQSVDHVLDGHTPSLTFPDRVL